MEETKDSINHRFKEAVEYLLEVKSVKNKTELANNIRLGKSTLSEILNGRMNISIDTVAIFCLLYEIRLEWLLNKKGKMVRPDEYVPTDPSLREIYERNVERSEIKHVQTNGIPLIPIDAMAGFGNGHTLQVMEYDTDRYIIPEFTELNVEFLIRMKGSSMLPKYNSGDILGCRRLPMDTFFQWNKVYVIDTIQGALVKRVHKSEKQGYITCVSDNENYPPFELNFDTDVNAIAIVLGVIRLE